MIGIRNINHIQLGSSTVSSHIRDEKAFTHTFETVCYPEGIQYSHHRHSWISDIRDDDPFMRCRYVRKAITYDHITGEPVRFDIANVIRRLQIADINDLYATETIGHKSQVILSVQAIHVRVRHIDTASQQVRQTKLVVTILLIEYQ